MKIRLGFVSNSSSSSFIVAGYRYKNEDINLKSIIKNTDDYSIDIFAANNQDYNIAGVCYDTGCDILDCCEYSITIEQMQESKKILDYELEKNKISEEEKKLLSEFALFIVNKFE